MLLNVFISSIYEILHLLYSCYDQMVEGSVKWIGSITYESVYNDIQGKVSGEYYNVVGCISIIHTCIICVQIMEFMAITSNEHLLEPIMHGCIHNVQIISCF